MSDNYDEEYTEEFNDGFSEEDILLIQKQFRKKRLIETLIGPVVSTLFHISLIVLLAVLITDKYKEEIPEIEVKLEDVEELKIEEPPPVEEPQPEEVEEQENTNPLLTNISIENSETEENSLEDVNDEAPSTEDDAAVEAVSDIVVSPSAFASPSVFGGRSSAGRASSVAKFGGSRAGQERLLRALYWLKKVQNANGSWGVKHQAAYTGLALLTFLAHGETTSSKEFGATVKKAMEWLANDKQDLKSGKGYTHAIKAYALAEAYAMTGVSILEEAMNSSIRVIINGQQTAGCYNYNYKKDNRADLSFAGWNYQALKAAYGAGCEERGLTEAIQKGVKWLRETAAYRDDGSSFPYSITAGKGPRGKHTMRAVGCLCLQLFGEGNTPEIADELLTISKRDLKKLSWQNPPGESLYGWYYATQVMFQKGGKSWKSWNRAFQKVLTNSQSPEGFWEYPGKWHGESSDLTTDRVYATTLCALMLTVYYRYLPSTKGVISKNVEKKGKPEFEYIGIDLLE